MARKTRIEQAESNFADACLFHLQNHTAESPLDCDENPCPRWNLMRQWIDTKPLTGQPVDGILNK